MIRDAGDRKRAKQERRRDGTARERVEAALRDGEHFLRRVMEVTPAVVHIYDLVEGRTVFINRSVASLLGYAPEEVEAMGSEAPRRLMHPEDLPRFDRHLARVRALADGEVAEFEHRMRHRDGGWRFLHSRDAVFLREPTGAARQLIGVATDLSARRQAEEALERNSALFSTLIAQAPMGTYVVDAEFRLRQVNRKAMPTFAALDPLIGRDFQEVMEVLWGPEIGGQCADIFRHTLQTGERYVSPPFTQLRHDLGVEQSYEWETQRVTLPDGQHGVVCYFHEVTGREATLAALRASADRLRLAAEATGIGVWEWNLRTNLIKWDAQMFRLYGVPPTPDGFVQYRDWSEAVLPDELAENEAILQDTVRRRARSSRTFRIRRRDDGAVRHITAVETVRTNAEDVAEWVLGTNLDVSERKRADDDLRRLNAALAQADRRKDAFIATLSHELRNPVATIRTAVDLLRLTREDRDTFEQTCVRLERQVGLLVRLIDDLMDVSRISEDKLTLQIERLDLAAVIQRAVESSRSGIEQRGHGLTVSLPRGPLELDADATRLFQVFANLLSNAAKYSDPGGAIGVTVERRGDVAVVEVRDRGIGIAAEDLPHVFEMFAQADSAKDKAQGGLGIGLHLVKRLVELHGGSVEAWSEGLGRGSRFLVRLPLPPSTTERASAPASEERPASPVATRPLRILVADDNEDAAISLAMVLERRGHTVRTVHDGAEAVSVASSWEPDVVLLDIGMPTLDGYEVCRRIRAQAWASKVVLVAVTGWGHADDKRRARDAGFDHHLVKPIALEALLQLVARPSP